MVSDLRTKHHFVYSLSRLEGRFFNQGADDYLLTILKSFTTMNRQKCMSRWRGDRMSIKRSTEKTVPFLFRVLMVYRIRLFCGFFRNRIFLFSEFTRSHFMTGVDIHNHTEKRSTSKILWAVFISPPRLAPIYFLIFFLELFGLVVERYPNQKLFFLSHSPT